MSHEAFQQAIFQEPDDDALRLIYADWLDENGESLWAELIRTQCELATSTPSSNRFVDLQERVIELRHRLANHPTIPKPETPRDTLWESSFIDLGLRRGFLTSMYLMNDSWVAVPIDRAQRLCDRLESFVDQFPLDSFRILDFGVEPSTMIMDRSFMSSVRELRFSRTWWRAHPLPPGTNPNIQVESVCRHSRFSRLQTLELDAPIDDQGLTMLANASNLQKLESLKINPASATQQGWEEFAYSPLAAQLTALEIPSAYLTPEAVQGLTSDVWPRLHTLKLTRTGLSTSAIETLAQSDAFPNLTSLWIEHDPLEPASIQALEKNRTWNLRELRLEGCELRSRSIQLLASSPFVQHLHTLSLRNNRIGIQGMTALIKSRQLKKLRRLDLSFNPLEGRQFRSLTRGNLLMQLSTLQLRQFNYASPVGSMSQGKLLMDSWELPSIRHLDLSGLRLGASGAKAMAKKTWASSIRILELCQAMIHDSGARALLEVLDPAELAWITLAEDKIAETTQAELRERFGSERVSFEVT